MNLARFWVLVQGAVALGIPRGNLPEETITIPIHLARPERSWHQELRKRQADSDAGLEADTVELLQNVQSMQYVGPILVGPSSQTFDCIFDTGSSDTWVYSSACKSAACQLHTRLNLEDTELPDDRMTIHYGSGTVEGVLATTDVSFQKCQGSCEQDKRCHCAYADVMLITHTIGKAFEYGEFNCIVGLAHPKLATDGTEMVLRSMILSGRLTHKYFGFYMTKTQDRHGSRFTLGNPDQNLFRGDLVFHDLYYPGDSSPSYWTLKLIKVVLRYPNRNQTLDTRFCEYGCEAAIDTGTSLITAPRSIAKDLIGMLGIDQRCESFDGGELPLIGFVFDQPTMTYWMSPESYVFREKEDKRDVCIGSFLPMDIPSHRSLWIIGDTFLSSYYSVYDFSCWAKGAGPCRLGLAAKSARVLEPGFMSAQNTLKVDPVIETPVSNTPFLPVKGVPEITDNLAAAQSDLPKNDRLIPNPEENKRNTEFGLKS